MTAKDLKKPHISRQVGELESWRYGEMQRGTETQCGEERWQWRKGWPQIHKWWTKIGRDTLGARDPNPSPDKSPKFLTVKTSGGWGGRRKCQIFRRPHLKDLQGLRTYANPPTLGFTTTTTVWVVVEFTINGASAKQTSKS